MVKKTAAVFVLILIAIFTLPYSGYKADAALGSVPEATEKIETIAPPRAAVSAEAASSVSDMPEISAAPIETISVSSMPQNTSQIHILRIAIKSSCLNKDMNVNVYLPPGYDTAKRYPVLYFLHGYKGNENDWEKKMDLVDSAYHLFSSGAIKPFIIVTPDIENSYCINSSISETSAAGISTRFKPNYGRYEDYFIEELIPYIDSNYSTVANREGRYIGGLSMGGYAALHLCFSHTGLFSKAGGHSPALWIYTAAPAKATGVTAFLYPSEKLREERDPLIEAESADLSGIKVWLDCGTRDSYGFYTGTKILYDILVSREAQVDYHAFSGGHSNSYWKTHLEEYLRFYGS